MSRDVLVVPGDATSDLLEKYKLSCLYETLSKWDLNKDFLSKMDNQDLEELITRLNLDLPERIRFKKMIRDLNGLHDSANLNFCNKTANHCLSDESASLILNNGFQSTDNKENEDNADYSIKLVVIGDAYVGKTSMVYRFAFNRFDGKQKSTVGIDFASQLIYNSNDESVFMRIWDTAGQERFDSINSLYIRDANCIIIVYDVTNYSTFESVEMKYKRLIENYSVNMPYIILVGNKYDLKLKSKMICSKTKDRKLMFDTFNDNYNNNNNNNYNFRASRCSMLSQGIESATDCDSDFDSSIQMVHHREALKLAQENNWGFKEVSAKSGYQVDSLFKACAEYTIRLTEQNDSIDLISSKRKNKSNASLKNSCQNSDGSVKLETINNVNEKSKNGCLC